MAVAQVRDVAKLAGVSPGTVSNALNHPEKVSEATLQRVMKAVDELGFVRNDAARQLRAGVNPAVGMVVLDISNPFFTDVARGVETELAEVQRPLLLADSNQTPSRELTYLTLFEEQRVAGLLITPTGDVLDRLRRLRDRGTSIVLVDRSSRAKDFSSVSVNDRLGGRLAAQHLIDGGHQSIWFVGGPASLSQVKDRLAGAQTALKKAPTVRFEFLETKSMDAAAGRQVADSIASMARSKRPDAIMAANDLIALGVLQGLTLQNIRVPEDIAIIGYDDIDFAASAAIPLSSVRQPANEMGQTAAQILLDVIKAPRDSEVRHVKLEPTLVVRNSTQA